MTVRSCTSKLNAVPPQDAFIPGIFSVVLLCVAGGTWLGNAPNRRRRKRIQDTPTSPIANASGGGPVEIYGRLAPSEHGLIVAPFSGKPAVFVRVIVEEYRSNGKSGHWATIVNESDSRDFFVDDGSGEYARVYVQGATFELNATVVGKSGTFNDAPPHLEAFLRSRGRASTTSLFGFNKSMRYSEELIVPGDSLYALGPSRRDAGPPTSAGYRTAQSSQLALFAQQGEAHELLLTNLSEAQLLAKLNSGIVATIVFLVLGGVLGTVAFGVIVAGAFG